MNTGGSGPYLKLEWRELGDGPQRYEDDEGDALVFRGWEREFAAPFPDGTWAYADATWYLDPLDVDVIVRMIRYIWCTDPERALESDVIEQFYGCESSAASWRKYHDVPVTDDEALRLCAEFDPRNIRWLHPRKLIIPTTLEEWMWFASSINIRQPPPPISPTTTRTPNRCPP